MVLTKIKTMYALTLRNTAFNLFINTNKKKTYQSQVEVLPNGSNQNKNNVCTNFA